MKTTKYFFMAALALMTAACSNEDNAIEQQPQMARGIPFTATISMGNSASTRALEEIAPNSDNPNGRIVATWAENEKVALIYTVGSTTFATPATVTPQTNGTATLSATLESGAVNGSDVTIIYPASAVDETTKNIKTDFLAGQDGTLAGIAANFDVRKGTGKLSINGGKATVYDGTPGTLVSLENQYAILKFKLQDIRGVISAADFKASALKVTSSTLNKSFSPSTASGEYYIALPGQTKLYVGAYWLNATIGDKAYVGKLRIETEFTLGKGKFYPTTVQMATVDDVVLSNGKFAAKGTTTDVVAKITYVVDASDATANSHGLAFALADESLTFVNGDNMWSKAKEKCEGKTPTVADATWMLPTKPQWQDMIEAAGSYTALANGFSSIGGTNLAFDYYWSSSVTDSDDTPKPVWVVWFWDDNDNGKRDGDDNRDLNGDNVVDELDIWRIDNVYGNFSARACLAF